MHRTSRAGRSQRGNILFLILLAVVLFAALSYAVTSSTRGGGKDGGEEKARVFATQLIEIGAALETTVLRTMMIDGTRDYGLDFSGPNSNMSPNNACSSEKCRIVQNGKVALISIPDWASSSTNVGSHWRKPYFLVASVENVGTTAPDLLVIHLYLHSSVCDAVNRVVGLPDSDALSAETAMSTWYNSNLVSFPTSPSVIGDQEVRLRGRTTFCYRATGGSTYNFAHVILAR